MASTMEQSINGTSMEKLYRAKVTYFERPFVSNKFFDYKVLQAANPYDFMVSIKDETNSEFEKQLATALEGCAQQLNTADKGELVIESSLCYVGMPVLFKEGEDAKLVRGQVLRIDAILLTLVRVDLGGVISVPKADVFPINLQTLRIPKLAIPCIMSQLRPDGDKKFWPADRDYAKDFTGASSRRLSFLDYLPASKAYEVCMEVDGINMAIKYYHDLVAIPVALGTTPTTAYPIPDFSVWIGLQVSAFGVKVFKDSKDGNKVKVVLQMEPEVVNETQEKIAAYVASGPQKEQLQFSKAVGAPVLADWSGEYYRAIIRKQLDGDKFLVEFVDYREESVVTSNQMLKVPADLLQRMEGAMVCQMTELLSIMDKFQNFDKLKELVENKDLYAVIDCCEPDIFGSDLLVSLFQPTDEFDGKCTSFLQLLDIEQKTPILKEILQMLEPIPPAWAPLFLKSLLPAGETLIPGASVSTLVNVNEDSIFIHFEGSQEKICKLSKELSRFYSFAGCTPDCREEWLSKPVVGQYVATPSNDSYLHRGKVVEETMEGMLKVLLIDDGRMEQVPKNDTYPLHVYFVKDPLVALEATIKKM